MKTTLITFLMSISLSACISLIEFPECEYIYTDPEQDSACFIKGIIEAWQANEEHVDKILLCNDNTFEINKYFDAIKKALRDFRSKDIMMIALSLRVILENTEHILNDTIHCVNSLQKFKLILDRVIYTKPLEFILRCFKNIIEDKGTINEDIKVLIEAYEKNDWYVVGYNLGEIIEHAILK